ncbi:hypothetical protein ACFVRU_34175 [Streptomyces sp. NPDC057927]
MTAMTATSRSRRRVVAAVSALLAALVLALLPLPSAATSAAAADGAGEDSAVTVTGKQGRYDDFSKLKVTVHQTKNLRSQGVRVTWQGGAPTIDGQNAAVNFLQIMQCWGDDPAGPDRDQCVFGGDGSILGAGNGRLVGTDPGETQYPGGFVPFRPVGDLPPTKSSHDFTYFGPLDTNEQRFARTYADGTGEVTFEAQDGIQASHLGCGMNTAPAGSDPVPRHCWLVVVPRGTHDADGTEITKPNQAGNSLQSSPLSATNWAQRMVVRLDFQPVDAFCPQGQPELPTVGSELMTDAVTSWQPKLCSSTGNTFAFTQGGEEEARGQVLSTSADAPLLGFTVDPVARPEDGSKVVHAPVAVSGLAIAFFIEGPSGVVQGMKLNPRLVAKMLTHSYAEDVTLGATPDYLTGNSTSLVTDPEFKELNPGFPRLTNHQLRSLMVPLQSSDTTRIVWNWLQSDADARGFLSGTKDRWGMRVNRYFQDLKLAENTTLTDYPKVDPTTTPALGNGTPPLSYAITDLDPYTADLHDGAVRTRRGNNTRTIQWQSGDTAQSPAKLINDAPMSGQRAVMAIVDAASAERYGLTTAALRNADGNFVKPSAATLTADVATMRPSSEDASVLKPDPARAKGQAYPLTAVAYAAASVNQDAKARKAYARFIRYVAGSGQTLGVSAGQLPFGYAPLPAQQRLQARTAADALERGATVTGPSSGGSNQGGTGGPGSGAGTGGTSSGGGTGGASGGGTGGGATPSASDSAAAVNGSAPPSSGPQQNVAEAKAGFTPGEILGVIRWILLVVLFLGGAAGLSGPIMLHFAQRRTP